jgi:hypothetical protein
MKSIRAIKKEYAKKLADYEKAKTKYEQIRKKMEAGAATEVEIGMESVSDMDLTGRANELWHLNNVIKKRRGRLCG